MRRLAVVSIIVAVTVIGLAAASAARADDPAFLAVSVGGFDVNDNESAGEFRIEYRSDRRYFFLKPMIGAMLNTDGGVGPLVGLMVGGKGSVFVYAGVYGDFFLGPKLVIRPEGGLGVFREGDAKDLGGVLEIHSALTIAYIFDNGARLGITGAHISNAGNHGSNPGLESLLLSYAVPIGPLF